MKTLPRIVASSFLVCIESVAYEIFIFCVNFVSMTFETRFGNFRLPGTSGRNTHIMLFKLSQKIFPRVEQINFISLMIMKVFSVRKFSGVHVRIDIFFRA